MFNQAIANSSELTAVFGTEMDEPMLTASDVMQIWTGNPLQWAISVGPLVVKPEPITVNNVGEFYMEAIASQAIALMPDGNFEYAMPLERVGRIVTVDFEPERQTTRSRAIAREHRVEKYHNDPPVPLLFFTNVPATAQRTYYHAVCRFMRSNLAKPDVITALETLLGEMINLVTQTEALYFAVRAQSLVTGAYRQKYLPVQVHNVGQLVE